MAVLGLLLIGAVLGWAAGYPGTRRVAGERDRDRRFMRTYREQLIAAKRELKGR